MRYHMMMILNDDDSKHNLGMHVMAHLKVDLKNIVLVFNEIIESIVEEVRDLLVACVLQGCLAQLVLSFD